jgi:hypothetical protein
MIKTFVLSMCLAISALSLNARAQDVGQYTDGPITELDYIQVEYGHFEEYVDWLNSTWKPTMEADHGSHEESSANHRFQGRQGHSKNTGSAQYNSYDHF